MRRLSSVLTRSADSGRPAGMPSSTATSPRPCDSPAVVKRNVILVAFGEGRGGCERLWRMAEATSTILLIIAREPDSGSGSRDVHALPPLHTSGAGVRG